MLGVTCTPIEGTRAAAEDGIDIFGKDILKEVLNFKVLGNRKRRRLKAT